MPCYIWYSPAVLGHLLGITKETNSPRDFKASFMFIVNNLIIIVSKPLLKSNRQLMLQEALRKYTALTDERLPQADPIEGGKISKILS